MVAIVGTQKGGPSPRHRPFSSILANSRWLSLLVLLLCWSASLAETCNRVTLGSLPRCRLFAVVRGGGPEEKYDVSSWKADMTETIQSMPDAAIQDASTKVVDLVSDVLQNTVGKEAATTASVVGGILRDLDGLGSPDPHVALGTMIQIIGKLSSVVAFAFPLGPIAPGVIKPLCAFVGSVLISGEGEQSLESRLESVTGKAFTEYRKEELGSQSWAVFERLKVRIKVLDTILGSSSAPESPGRISEFTASMVSGSEFLTDGIFELERLWYFIDKRIREAKSEDEGSDTADYLFFYVLISFARMQELTLLSCLYQEVGADVLTSAVQSLINGRIEVDGGRLAKILGVPERDRSMNFVYSAIHSPQFRHRGLLESYGKITAAGGFGGRLLRINTLRRRDGKQSRAWLQCKERKGKKRTELAVQTDSEEDGTLFRYFEDTQRLFSCNEGAYVFPDQENSRKGTHFVYAHHDPNETAFQRGQWRLPEDDSGTIEFRWGEKAWSSVYVSNTSQTHNRHFRIKTGPSEKERPEVFYINDVE